MCRGSTWLTAARTEMATSKPLRCSEGLPTSRTDRTPALGWPHCYTAHVNKSQDLLTKQVISNTPQAMTKKARLRVTQSSGLGWDMGLCAWMAAVSTKLWRVCAEALTPNLTAQLMGISACSCIRCRGKKTGMHSSSA